MSTRQQASQSTMSPSVLDTDGPGYEVIPLSYKHADSESSARALVFVLKPEWEKSEGDIEFIAFKDGITNTVIAPWPEIYDLELLLTSPQLLKASKRRPGLSQHEIDVDAVLLRAYGNGTEVLIDRDREAANHALLASLELAPPLLARFDNGLLYKFIEGYACSAADLRRPEVFHSVAQVLAQWHGMLPTIEPAEPTASEKVYPNITGLLNGKPRTNVWTVMQKWIKALSNTTKADRARNETLQKELELMTKTFGNTAGLDAGAYVLSHCDLLCGNVIVRPGETATSTEVAFIDYEYALPAPAAFDIANHFSEWGGLECDYEVLPTRRERREFLQSYVTSYRASSAGAKANGHSQGQSEEQDVETLMQEIDAFRGIPGFYWGIWALIQAMISQIDFDYAKYAESRLGEYWAWKAETDGSRAREGKEVPLRERRWAQEG